MKVSKKKINAIFENENIPLPVVLQINKNFSTNNMIC